MNAKMLAGMVVVLGLLAGGCARFGLGRENVMLIPDEHVRYVAHPLSAALELPLVPPDAPQAAGAPDFQVEMCVIQMSPSFEKQMGISEKLSGTISKEKCDQLVHAAKISQEAIVVSSPHMTVHAGKTEVVQLSTTAAYASDYARDAGTGIWVPVFSSYSPSRILCRVKPAIEGEVVVLDNVAWILSQSVLVPCSGEFHFPKTVRACWSEPVRTTYSIALDNAVRLKANEGMLMTMTVTEERGYPGVCRALSNVRQQENPSCATATYLLILPPTVLPKAQETARAKK